MWIKGAIEPAHIISYLEKLDHTLSYITLNEIKVISKNKKSEHIWKQNIK